MRTIIKLAPLAMVAIAGAFATQACGTVPNDTVAGTGTELIPSGVVRGTVFYNGPPPCTQNGQIVGNAILLMFDRRNPPPPAGLANTAVNFATVSGDVLFGNIPRTTSATKSCLNQDTTVLASAPFAISPLTAGSYVIQAFYDYTGDFLPTFKFRNLPEATDIGGGYIDINDANKLVTSAQSVSPADGGAPFFPTEPQSASPSYQPVFLPINIGTPGVTPSASLRDVPEFTMPGTGYVADNVTVYIGSQLPFARPYFYPEAPTTAGSGNLPIASAIIPNGSAANKPTAPVKSKGNPNGDLDYEPVLSFPQDIQIQAQPLHGGTLKSSLDPNIQIADEYQASFPQIRLDWGVPPTEAAVAADTTNVKNPFHMQLSPTVGGNGGFFVFQYDSRDTALSTIPETLVPRLWPLVVLAKLEDFCTNGSSTTGNCDATHALDPQNTVYQGTDLTKPIVIIQAITLAGDTLLDTVESTPSAIPTASGQLANLVDHFTALLRPNVICFDPRHVDRGGTIVTPFECGPVPPGDNADPGTGACGGQAGIGNVIQPETVLANPQLAQLVNPTDPLQFACLPPGRYGINVVYPTGQAWTSPNEIGRCAASEGLTIDGTAGNGGQAQGNCALQSRPVLYSQGTRAVVEITPSASNACVGKLAVPKECTTLTGD